MTAYVILGRLTQKAIENAEEMVERDGRAERAILAAGGQLLARYYTWGRYDFILIVDFPSEEALARVMMEINRLGALSTETMTALLPEQVYRAARGA
ncbi:MAG: GYD domain-containing protein [Methanospirillum sp.]|nr:GYD domain-containing protein [Methanospirillum sp.]